MNASPPEQDRLRLGSVVFSGEGVAEMDQHKRVVFVPRDQVLGITLAYGSAAERPFLTLGIALVTLVISLYPVVYAINRYLTATVIQGEVLYLLRSEEHTSELQSPYVISYAVFCLKKR